MFSWILYHVNDPLPARLSVLACKGISVIRPSNFNLTCMRQAKDVVRPPT